MTKNPKVSVVMPNYNRERYVGEAIESALNQTYKDLELIIIDDGSTDNSSEVISRYQDERIKLLSLPHSGLPGAVRNRGIEASRGELIAFLDSDDIWMREKLEMQINLLESDYSTGLIHTDFQEINEKGQILVPSVQKIYKDRCPRRYKPSGWCFKEFVAGNVIGNSSVLLKREVLERVGFFDVSLKVTQDYDLWVRITRHYQIGFIDRPLYQYRQHPSNITKNIIIYCHDIIKVMDKIMQGNSDLRHELSPIVNRRLGRCHFRLSREYLERGQCDEAWKHAVRAIAYNPLKPTRHLLFFLSCLLGVPAIYWYFRKRPLQDSTNIIKH